MNQPIEWSDPPPRTKPIRSNNKWFVEQLQKRPQTWALWKSNVVPAVGGQFRQYYPGVKITMRHTGEKNKRGYNTYNIWAMWDPEGTGGWDL